ncbi:hypothetical protein C2S51_026476 [Perilla frutescens var. frutescens]|nr:hypothetical protein C2S51_026476 [Perilla frutescens var. frutescens]
MDAASVVVNGTLSCLSNVRPPMTSHAPSMWADTFFNSSVDEQLQQEYAEAIEALTQEAGGMLMAARAPLEQLILIDTLERLGLAYHFETEIEHELLEIYNAREEEDCDLFTTSLQFRLLRQHQHHVSCNVFDKFVDKDREFEETLSSDLEGLLSLYETAHIRFHDEKILDEAARFTENELSRMESQLEPPLKEKVKRALEHPFHREVPIFHTRIFISIYEKDDSRDELLLKLAKLNFNFLQNLYKNELAQLSRWWNKFDLKSKLPYIRDRLVESYIWGASCHYEPQYSYVRMGIAKVLLLATMMDDTYDNYATINEAQLFTQSLERWNMDGMVELPDCMKILSHFIFNIFQDYERDAAKQGRQFAAPYFKETVQQIARAYNQELKWLMGRQMPSFQDYAKNSVATSCIFLMFAITIPTVKSVSEETITWMKSETKFVTSTAMIGRYRNDIVSSERENKGGEMMTVVDCYMKQYGVSKEEAITKFAEEIENGWKDVNKEWSMTTRVPKETTLRLLNYARIADATYKNRDGFTDPSIFAAFVANLFIHPVRTTIATAGYPRHKKKQCSPLTKFYCSATDANTISLYIKKLLSTLSLFILCHDNSITRFHCSI